MSHNARTAEMNDGHRRGTPVLVAFSLFLTIALLGFIALGVWQIQRMQWKQALIERVDSRISATAVAAPARAQWASVSIDSNEYQRVFVEGQFLSVPDTKVQALTEAGPGWWLFSPLQTDDGQVVLINRGFVPSKDLAQAKTPDTGTQRVEGLLRISEPQGRVLRKNVPSEDRWYSRDVGAIATKRGLQHVAPYFIDADARADASWPRGGMTVVKFRDNHQQYALTWFGMALLTAFALWKLLSSERVLRQHSRSTAADSSSDAGLKLPRD